jgi:hypothetical protein
MGSTEGASDKVPAVFFGLRWRLPAGSRNHDRMPLIIAPSDYERWLSDDPDLGDL